MKIMAAKNKFFLYQKGQALIELIVFLPFLVMLYAMIMSIGNAINGSINQQKVTRGYFFLRIQNSSTITRPMRPNGGSIHNQFSQSIGHFFIGWADFLDSENPVYPCYKMHLPFAPPNGEECNQPYTQTTTQLVRVGTVYGICGGTYVKRTDVTQLAEAPFSTGTNGSAVTVLNKESCQIK